MSEVSYIFPSEKPQLDASQIETLRATMGPSGAENVICRAMEELALRMGRIENLAEKDPENSLPKLLRGLSAIASQVGMVGLASVAQDAMNCLTYRDPVALAATLERLARIGEQSIRAMWDHNDLLG